jgi:hypothetical protein
MFKSSVFEGFPRVFSLFLSDVIIKILFCYRIVYNSIVVKLFIGPTRTLRRSEMTRKRGIKPGLKPGKARKPQKTQEKGGDA